MSIVCLIQSAVTSYIYSEAAGLPVQVLDFYKDYNSWYRSVSTSKLGKSSRPASYWTRTPNVHLRLLLESCLLPFRVDLELVSSSADFCFGLCKHYATSRLASSAHFWNLQEILCRPHWVPLSRVLVMPGSGYARSSPHAPSKLPILPGRIRIDDLQKVGPCPCHPLTFINYFLSLHASIHIIFLAHQIVHIIFYVRMIRSHHVAT